MQKPIGQKINSRKNLYLKEPYFPEEFIKKYKALLGDEWEEFFSTIKQEKENTFWINTNNTTIEEVKKSLKEKGVEVKQLPYHNQSYTTTHPKPSNLEEYKNGKISLQEKASMLPAIALNPPKGSSVFDTCAAPGMKTIQLSNMVGEQGTVLATELNNTRHILLDNIVGKFNCKNVKTKRIDFRNIKRNKKFDFVLLDAPCSSEGLIRKQREALIEWSPALVRKKAANQKNLIVKAFDYVKEG
ncbi:MAG: RsmB/NOP family class I SAM-dependent RNA methyltransferase, partial [Candidatus Diapherotrites archaeon]|nr:RsmB/NOP family class I SAM-dependent RNA methyltransferase [Candidatus Diapherotrites archaeon]